MPKAYEWESLNQVARSLSYVKIKTRSETSKNDGLSIANRNKRKRLYLVSCVSLSSLVRGHSYNRPNINI